MCVVACSLEHTLERERERSLTLTGDRIATVVCKRAAGNCIAVPCDPTAFR